MSAQLDALRDEVIAQLDKGYDLIYVDYRDKLTGTQVDAVVQQDWEAFDEDRGDWEGESQYEGAKYHAEQEVKGVIIQWMNRDDREYDGLYDEFYLTTQWDEVIDAIRERDTSNPWKELAHNTGKVLMRQIIVNEDGGWAFEHVTSTKVIQAFNEWAEPGTVFKRNKHNLKVVRDVLTECSPEYSVLLGMIVYAVDVGDLFDMPWDTEYVDIVNPHLYLGNPFAGSGYCEGPLDATIRVKRKELTTDKGAFGYGWDEVAGVVTSYYDAEVKAVPATTPEGMAA